MGEETVLPLGSPPFQKIVVLFLNEFDFCWRNVQHLATQVFQNESAFRSSACDVPESAFCQHLIVLPVSADFVPALRESAHSAFGRVLPAFKR